jgi:hypothetical protein
MRHGRNGDFEWLTGGLGQSAAQGTELERGDKRRSIK